jgi:hypothetical protein
MRIKEIIITGQKKFKTGKIERINDLIPQWLFAVISTIPVDKKIIEISRKILFVDVDIYSINKPEPPKIKMIGT